MRRKRGLDRNDKTIGRRKVARREEKIEKIREALKDDGE